MPYHFSVKNLRPKHFLVAVLAAYFFFGLQHLTQFITADEHYWVYERIPQYWDAVTEGKWKKTFINDKPGISLALVSGAGLLSEPQPEKHLYENPDRTLVYDINDTESLYRAFRLPILIANALLLFYLFWIIGKLTDPWITLWSVTLSALSPILLGISQIVNPDSLLWSLGAAAIFSYFALLTSGEKKYFWLTIVFTGFALLTKYVAFILFLFYLALTLLRFLTEEELDETSLARRIRTDLSTLALIAVSSIALLCLFLPALFLDSKYVAELIQTVPDKEELAMFGSGLFALLLIDIFVLKNRLLFAVRHIGLRAVRALRVIPLFFLTLIAALIIIRNFFPDWSIFTQIPFDIKDLSDARYHADIPNFFEAFLLEWNPLVFSLTPIALFGFIALLITLSGTAKRAYAFLVYSLLFFFLLYSVLLIYSNVLTTPRYSILLYPLFAFLAALGIWHITEWFSWPHTKLVATLIIFLGSLASLLAISPFYFNYTNTLLPKSALINDAWGYGGYEAAQYLNSLPDAKNLTVWIDYYGVCEFFVGHCLSAYTFDPTLVKPDYYVLTRRGQIRYMSRSDRWERLSGLTAYRYYNAPNPAWQIFIGNRPGNFVKVVKVEKR